MKKTGTKPAKRGPGRPREAERDLRSEAILTAAADVFLEQGFARASTDEIARRAGASKQTFYSRYPSKADLFAAVMRRRSEQLANPVAAAVLKKHSPIEQTLFHFALQVLRANLSEDGQRLQRLLLAETSSFPDLAEAFWQNGPGYGKELLKNFFEQTRAEKVLVIDDASQAADHFMSLVFGWIMLRASFHLPPAFATDRALAKWVRSAVNVFLRAYRPVDS